MITHTLRHKTQQLLDNWEIATYNRYAPHWLYAFSLLWPRWIVNICWDDESNSEYESIKWFDAIEREIERVPATLGGTAIPRSRFDAQSVCRQAEHKGPPRGRIHNKLRSDGFINVPNQIDTGHMVRISEIRLRRTDTTLDLSQKAEKVWGKKKWTTLTNSINQHTQIHIY